MSASPFPMIESAVRELIETEYPGMAGRIGGDLRYEAGSGPYVWIGLIPGGSANQIEGDWVLDIDVFADHYGSAMGFALDLEAALVGPRHVTSVMMIDNCYQNTGPAERPWDDERVFRVGATYVFTARRPTSG